MQNLKELAPEQIGEMILNSDDWVVLRYEKENEGIHVHVNQQTSISLIPIMLASDPNLLSYIEKAVEHIKNIQEKDGN